MVEREPSKLTAGVRFSYPAPFCKCITHPADKTGSVCENVVLLLNEKVIAGRVRSPARSHKPLPSLVQIQAPQPVCLGSLMVECIFGRTMLNTSKGLPNENI